MAVRQDGFRIFQDAPSEFAGRYTRATAEPGEDELEYQPSTIDDLRVTAYNRLDFDREHDRHAFRGLSKKYYSEYVDPYEEDAYTHKPESADNISAFKEFVHKQTRIRQAVDSRRIQPKQTPRHSTNSSQDNALAHLEISMTNISSKHNDALQKSRIFIDVVHYLQPKLLPPLEQRHSIATELLVQKLEMLGLSQVEPEKDREQKTTKNSLIFRMLDDEMILDGNVNAQADIPFLLRIIGSVDEQSRMRIERVSIELEKHK